VISLISYGGFTPFKIYYFPSNQRLKKAMKKGNVYDNVTIPFFESIKPKGNFVY